MNGFGEFLMGVSLDGMDYYDGYIRATGISVNEDKFLIANQGVFYSGKKVDNGLATINAVFDKSYSICDTLDGYRFNDVPAGGIYASFSLITKTNAKSYVSNFVLKVYQVEIAKVQSVSPEDYTLDRVTCEYKFSGQFIQNTQVYAL